MGTPCDWRGLSNVQCDEVMAHRMVWWSWVGAVPVCPPVSPCRGASIVQFLHTMRVFWHGNAAMRTFGWAHRRRPYGFVWVDCAQTVDFVWWIACGRLMSLERIACKWLFCLCGIVWKNMMEMGRGGACVPAPVSPCRGAFAQIITIHTLFYFKKEGAG